MQDVLEDKIKEHPRLAEFQEVMKPKSKSQTFTNSEIASAQPVNVSIAAPAMDDINRPPRHGELRARHLPNEKGEDWDKDDPDTHGSDGLEDVLDDSISDTEYLRRRMKYFEAEGHNDDGIASDDPPGGISNAHEDGQEETHDIFSSDPAAKIAQTGRLFFRNLPYVATDIELQELCLPFGAVSDATVVRDRATGKSKGFAVVSFAAPADAVAAYQALDASIFQGRLIHVLPGNRPKAEASPVESAKTHEGRRGTRSFKAEAEAKRRADAGNRSAWSSYYMRDDTVAEAIADLTGISKAELLSPDAADAAVRLALGEAQV
jgi:multiple RNA-binding domain-containing protein 1